MSLGIVVGLKVCRALGFLLTFVKETAYHTKFWTWRIHACSSGSFCKRQEDTSTLAACSGGTPVRGFYRWRRGFAFLLSKY